MVHGPWDQQLVKHLGTREKVRLSGPTPDLMNQNLHLNQIAK